MFFTQEKNKKLSETEFEKGVEALVKWVRDSVSPFPNDTAAKQSARARRARGDQEFFNQTYLPHYFLGEGADCHREWEELCEEGERLHRPVGVVAPRDHAKSTCLTFARPLKKILFKEKKFLVEMGEDKLLSQIPTVSIRTELEVNPRIIRDFKSLKTREWSNEKVVTKDGSMLLSRTWREGIRGLKHGPYRVDWLGMDDMENDEMQKNPERVKDLVKRVNEEMSPAVDPDHGQMFWVGNLLSTRCGLATIIKNPEWISKIYRAVKDPIWGEAVHWDPYHKMMVGGFTAGIPLWPARWPLEKLSAKRRLIGSIAFNKEYQNDPRDDEAKIKEEWIKRIRYDLITERNAVFFQALDPSLGETEMSDFQGHSTIARMSDVKYVLRHADIRRRSIDAMVKNTYLLQRRFGALAVGLETIGFQKLLKRDFAREALVQKRHLPIVPIDHHSVSKIPRILSRSSLIENGFFLFAEGPENEVGDMDTMIEQWLYIESGSVHDDGPDSAEMATTLAEGLAGSKPSYERVEGREASFGVGAW